MTTEKDIFLAIGRLESSMLDVRQDISQSAAERRDQFKDMDTKITAIGHDNISINWKLTDHGRRLGLLETGSGKADGRLGTLEDVNRDRKIVAKTNRTWLMTMWAVASAIGGAFGVTITQWFVGKPHP